MISMITFFIKMYFQSFRLAEIAVNTTVGPHLTALDWTTRSIETFVVTLASAACRTHGGHLSNTVSGYGVGRAL